MGIFSRFTDIVNSNINSILDKAEDPEKLVRLMIQEMEDTLVEVRSTAARAIADRKEITRSLAGLEAEAREWQTKAELALDKNREDLAKAALAEKARATNAAGALRAQHQALGEGLDKLNDDVVRLEEKLVDAKTRQQAIRSRQRTASGRLEARKRLHNARNASAPAVARAFSPSAAFARSSRFLSSASSALACQSRASLSRPASEREISLRSAIARAAVERTSTNVSSISWIMRRTSFSGSSALSRIELMFEFTMSVKREKMPMARSPLSGECDRQSRNRASRCGAF